MAKQFLRTDNQKKRIAKVVYLRESDDSPDLSCLGEYSNQPDAVHIDREERGDRGHGEYRYFNMSSNYTDEKPEDQQKYMEQDYRRMEDYGNGWCMMFLQCQAQVVINGIVQTITSGGLGGVESDSDEDYFEEIKKEQLDELAEVLRSMGFSKKAISTAFKECKDQ